MTKETKHEGFTPESKKKALGDMALIASLKGVLIGYEELEAMYAAAHQDAPRLAQREVELMAEVERLKAEIKELKEVSNGYS